MKAVPDLGQRQRAHPGGRELDGQRHAVEPVTDLGYHGDVVVGDGEVGAGVAGPVREQLDGLIRE